VSARRKPLNGRHADTGSAWGGCASGPTIIKAGIVAAKPLPKLTAYYISRRRGAWLLMAMYSNRLVDTYTTEANAIRAGLRREGKL
jgi:hypothetical protein